MEATKKFLKNNKLAILTVIILGLITHFYLYTHNVLSTDAVATGTYHISGVWEKSLGRWAIVFFDVLKGGIVNEGLNICISLIVLSISSSILIKILDIKNNIIIFLISAIIATAPQFAESFMYIYCADAYCFAMLTALLAVYFMKKENKWVNNLMAIIMIILTCAIYQSYIGETVGLSIFLIIFYILQQKENKQIIKDGIKYVVIEILGILLYYAITIIILKLQGLSFASYSGAYKVGIVNTLQNIHINIFNTYKTFFKYFFTDQILYNNYWKRHIINLVIFIITIISVLTVIIKNKIYKDRVKMLLLVILVILLPIGVNIIELITPDRRINLIMATSLLLVYIAFLKLYELIGTNNIGNLMKYFIICTIPILCITYIFSNNASYMCREETYKNYYTISLSIITKAQNLEGYNSNMKFMFNDIIRYDASLKEYANGFKSNDYETWDNYEGIVSNVQFYKRYLGMDITVCSKEEYNSIIESEEFKQMDIFPNDNSIKIINDIVVVKLSSNNILDNN